LVDWTAAEEVGTTSKTVTSASGTSLWLTDRRPPCLFLFPLCWCFFLWFLFLWFLLLGRLFLGCFLLRCLLLGLFFLWLLFLGCFLLGLFLLWGFLLGFFLLGGFLLFFLWLFLFFFLWFFLLFFSLLLLLGGLLLFLSGFDLLYFRDFLWICLGSSLPKLSVLSTTSLSLLCELLLSGLFSLGLVNVLHQHSFVLEDIALSFQIQFMI